MSVSPEPRRKGGVAEAIVGPVILVAVALLIGWVLLVTVKWFVVLAMYVLGAALIVGPLLGGSRALDGVHGRERFRRIVTLVGVVCAGILLILAAGVVRHHGWVLVAIPLAVLAVDRLRKRIGRRPSTAG